jgi:sensor histidine kinase YesM
MALASPLSRSTDTRLRLAGPFVLAITGIMFFRLQMYLSLSGPALIRQIGIALAAGYFGWEITRFTALYIQHRLPGLHRMATRVIFLLLALVILSHIGYAFRRIAHIIVDNESWQWPSLLDYSATTGVVIFYATVTLGIYEGAYIWKQWKQTFAEKEKLIQSQWQVKYDLLKAQINPHFLFNSLNSLSSLIAEDPGQAEKYADEMSRVYRYLLRNNDQELVSLRTEMQFIRSYGHLLKTRHGDGFLMTIHISDEYNDYLVPSLTLQLLVENAVKHNAVIKEHPLKVAIFTNDKEELIVENNKQKKTVTVQSNGVGLANINTRFKLLNQEGIFIEETEQVFRVIIPLIKEMRSGADQSKEASNISL